MDFKDIKRKAKESQFITNVYNGLLYVLYVIDYKTATKFEYFFTFGKKIDISNPKTFNDKIIYLKFFDNTSLKAKCADKYCVREYIQEKGYENILNECYCCLDNPENIEFDKLPDDFIIKCTNGSGSNLVVKKPLDKHQEKDIIKKCKKWLKIKYGLNHYEPQYLGIKSKIIIEKFLKDTNKDALDDYNFYCCNGKPIIIRQFSKTSDHNKWQMYYYDINKKIVGYNDYAREHHSKQNLPNNFDEMIEVAKELSKDFKFVRVDLFNVNNRIVFNELTFTPTGGFGTHFSEEIDKALGEALSLE